MNVTNGSISAGPTLTLGTLQEVMRKMQELCPPAPNVVVRVSPDLPKFQISPECPLTDDFRKEMNAWCLSFFGTENLLKDGESYQYSVDGTTVVLVNPRTFARLSPQKRSFSSLGYEVYNGA